MKTILVIYTNKKLTKSSEIGKNKRYAFNTEADLKEGDMFESNDYSTKLQVVKVLDKSYIYYNASTGELSDMFTSASQWLIRTVVIREDVSDVVYASLVKEQSDD